MRDGGFLQSFCSLEIEVHCERLAVERLAISDADKVITDKPLRDDRFLRNRAKYESRKGRENINDIFRFIQVFQVLDTLL